MKAAFTFFFLFIVAFHSGPAVAQPDVARNEVWMQKNDQDFYKYLGVITYLSQGPYAWDGDYGGRVGEGYKFVVNSTETHDNISIIKVRYRPEDNWSHILWISYVNKNYLNEVLGREGDYRVQFVRWTGVDEFVFQIDGRKVKAKILGENVLKIL